MSIQSFGDSSAEWIRDSFRFYVEERIHPDDVSLPAAAQRTQQKNDYISINAYGC